MGRAERRRIERQNRIESRKNKILMEKEDIHNMKEDISNQVSSYSTEILMTCFALAEHRLYKFGRKRILRSLQYIDDLMSDILNDKATIDDYKNDLKNEVGLSIKCD